VQPVPGRRGRTHLEEVHHADPRCPVNGVKASVVVVGFRSFYVVSLPHLPTGAAFVPHHRHPPETAYSGHFSACRHWPRPAGRLASGRLASWRSARIAGCAQPTDFTANLWVPARS
jgi:hypothetical protein